MVFPPRTKRTGILWNRRKAVTAAGAVLVAFGKNSVNGFAVNNRKVTGSVALQSFLGRQHQVPLVDLHMTSQDDVEVDNEIERLRSMAAKLRAEAAQLEAERAQSLADAAEKAFRRFDTNQDGQISLEELKEGLQKMFKTDLSDSRVEALMETFDDSGDGALQLEEFVGVEQFRNKLEQLAQEEKRLASEARKQALVEAEEAEKAEARLEILNERPPTNTDKVLSILPYLFPLMDGLQYGRFLLLADDGSPSNPLVVILALINTLYRSIPFSGFVAFLVLSFLTGTPSLNRLIRFNTEQAIFLDLALFLPGLISGLYSILASSGQTALPDSQIFSDFVFVTLLITLAYCTVSSLLGIQPDKIPIISQAVKDRMPTLDMFDEKGNFIPRVMRERKDDEDKDDEDE